MRSYESMSLNRVVTDKLHYVKLGLHDVICPIDSFVFVPNYCVNLKAMRYDSRSLIIIVADKLHHLTLTFSSLRSTG